VGGTIRQTMYLVTKGFRCRKEGTTKENNNQDDTTKWSSDRSLSSGVPYMTLNSYTTVAFSIMLFNNSGANVKSVDYMDKYENS